jgi:hypothetical protein
MRSKLTLLTTAAALAFGLTATAALAADVTSDAPGAKSDITIVGTTQGGAGGAETQAAPDQGNAVLPDAGDARAAAQGSPPASDKGGAAAQGGAQDQGAAAPDTQKQGQLPSPSSSY